MSKNVFFTRNANMGLRVSFFLPLVKAGAAFGGAADRLQP